MMRGMTIAGGLSERIAPCTGSRGGMLRRYVAPKRGCIAFRSQGNAGKRGPNPPDGCGSVEA